MSVYDQKEWEFFATNTTSGAKNLSDIKLEFFAAQGHSANATSLKTMERRWLADLAGGADDAKPLGDLLREALVAQGIPLGGNLQEMWHNLYSFYTP